MHVTAYVVVHPASSRGLALSDRFLSNQRAYPTRRFLDQPFKELDKGKPMGSCEDQESQRSILLRAFSYLVDQKVHDECPDDGAFRFNLLSRMRQERE